MIFFRRDLTSYLHLQCSAPSIARQKPRRITPANDRIRTGKNQKRRSILTELSLCENGIRTHDLRVHGGLYLAITRSLQVELHIKS